MTYKPRIYNWITQSFADNCEVVIVYDEDDNCFEPLGLYPEEDMETIEALLKFAQKTFPNGWQVINGEVVEYQNDVKTILGGFMFNTNIIMKNLARLQKLNWKSEGKINSAHQLFTKADWKCQFSWLSGTMLFWRDK